MKFRQHRIQREDRSEVSSCGSSIYINFQIVNTLFSSTFYPLYINDLMLRYIFIAENSFYTQYFFFNLRPPYSTHSYEPIKKTFYHNLAPNDIYIFLDEVVSVHLFLENKLKKLCCDLMTQSLNRRIYL